MQHARDSRMFDGRETTEQAEMVYGYVTSNEYDAEKGVVVHDMQFTETLIHCDTATGIPEPPRAPEGYPQPGGNPADYPVAPCGIRLIAPAKGEALRHFYCIVGTCIGAPVSIISRETGRVLKTITATGQYTLLYCTGMHWLQDQCIQLEP